jgi:hypothetical protein
MMKYLLILGLLLVTQCENDDPVACTQEFVYGLNVTVKDAISEEFLIDNVAVTAVDGSYEEVLMTLPGNNVFFGGGERPGTYVIQIIADGYEPFISEPVFVDSDICHVIPKAVEFQLQPQ